MTSIAEDLVDPPTFYLPSGFEDTNSNSDYEVWSLRTPVLFDPSSLDGIALSFNDDILSDQSQTKQKYGGGSGGGTTLQQDNVISSFELSNDSNDRYSIVVGHTSETKSFRVLVPTKPISESDSNENEYDDDEYAKKNMKLHSIPFTRHVNLIRSSKVEMTEFDMAPSKELAPKPQITAIARTGDSKQNAALKMVMREAYSHVEQVKGLKRRWNMFGSNVDVDAAQERQKRRRQAYVDKEALQQQTSPDKNKDRALMNNPDDGSNTTNETPNKKSTSTKKSKKSKKEKKASEKKKRRKSSAKGSSTTKKESKKSKKKKHRDSSKSPKKLE